MSLPPRVYHMSCTLTETGRQAQVMFDLESGLSGPLPVEAQKARLWDTYVALRAFVDGPNGPELPEELKSLGDEP